MKQLIFLCNFNLSRCVKIVLTPFSNLRVYFDKSSIKDDFEIANVVIVLVVYRFQVQDTITVDADVLFYVIKCVIAWS